MLLYIRTCLIYFLEKNYNYISRDYILYKNCFVSMQRPLTLSETECFQARNNMYK